MPRAGVSASAELLVDTCLSSYMRYKLQCYPRTVLNEIMSHFRGRNILYLLLNSFKVVRTSQLPVIYTLLQTFVYFVLISVVLNFSLFGLSFALQLAVQFLLHRAELNHTVAFSVLLTVY